MNLEQAARILLQNAKDNLRAHSKHEAALKRLYTEAFFCELEQDGNVILGQYMKIRPKIMQHNLAEDHGSEINLANANRLYEEIKPHLPPFLTHDPDYTCVLAECLKTPEMLHVLINAFGILEAIYKEMCNSTA